MTVYVVHTIHLYTCEIYNNITERLILRNIVLDNIIVVQYTHTLIYTILYHTMSSSDSSSGNLRSQLKVFWEKQGEDIKKLCEENSDFKNHNDLPLARIKRIMKSDEDVRMIRAEAPVLFAKACELFILELTLRAYCNSENTDLAKIYKKMIYILLLKILIFLIFYMMY